MHTDRVGNHVACDSSSHRPHRYTLHLDFAATDAKAAQELAVDLAEGLGLLRPDVETYSALLTSDGRWEDPRPVFCLAAGPDGVFCADLAGHPGWHAEAGISGLRWSQIGRERGPAPHEAGPGISGENYQRVTPYFGP
jgi:hypothetical protein